MNVNFRARVRVVDFFPPKLEDFSHSLDDPLYNDMDMVEESTVMDLDKPEESRWEWAFWLLLEDYKKVPGKQSERMKVLVAGPGAEFLLNMEACE
jgi:protection-of-telomeres protein 1